MGRRHFALSNRRIDLDLLQVNKKKTETPVKIGKANEQMIYREETLEANQHNEMLGYIIIRKTQVEKQCDHFIHIRLAKIRTLDTDKCWGEMSDGRMIYTMQVD